MYYACKAIIYCIRKHNRRISFMKSTRIKLTKKKIIGIVAAILVVALISVWILGSCGKDGATQAAEYEPYTVSRGDITVSVTGSGTVEPIEQYEIQSIVTGDITEDYVSVGTNVEKDQVLYVIDSESAKNSIDRAQTSYEQQLLSYNEKVSDYNKTQANRAVSAPVTGVITELFVKNGDEVNAGTKLCEISNSEYLTVRVPFLAVNANNISLNQTATVYFDDRNESHSGYVSHVTTGTYATEAGAVVSDIEITFKNPGAILPGEIVTATIGSYACNDYGSVEEASVETVTAKVSGDIENLNFSKGDKISGGSLLLNITDDSSRSDLRNSELALKNSRLSLDDQIKKLEDYTIKSPITGTVISKTMKEGDTLDGNKSSLAIVADMSKLTFDISVDELYIKDISVGQKVAVTADALPDKIFEGTVDTVSIIGTPTSGVTVYPVTVVISEYEGLLPGMNVDAEIVIASVSDVLTIPVNAVSRGNLVMVAESSPAAGITPPTRGNKGTPPQSANNAPAQNANNAPQNKGNNAAAPQGPSGKPSSGTRFPDAPDGYKYIMVETGLASDDYVEVISGLSEGDVIYVTVTKNTSAASTFGMPGGMGGGMPGGMGGGMPGGMPSGGMQGRNRGNMSGGTGGMR